MTTAPPVILVVLRKGRLTMSLVEVARDALKEIPMSDVLRERLSLALDRLSDAEAKNESLQQEIGKCQSLLEQERVNHEKTKQELQTLRDKLHEDVRVFESIEFRRGERTGNAWVPFCPKCHVPVIPRDDGLWVFCASKCGWVGREVADGIQAIVNKMEQDHVS
jgi:hypothetical protein